MKKLRRVPIFISLLAFSVIASAQQEQNFHDQRRQQSRARQPGHSADSYKKAAWDNNCTSRSRQAPLRMYEVRKCPPQPGAYDSAGYGPVLRPAPFSEPAVHPDDVTVLGTISLQ